MNGALPLLIAISGHRDPRSEDAAALEAAFAEHVLFPLRAHLPDTPLVVMSALSDGADRIAARAALAAGLSLVAVIPDSVAGYRSDFDTQSLAEFDALLARATRVVETGCRDSADPRGYVAAGNWLLHHAHVLVAFWDGNGPRKAGGTYDVLLSALEGIDADGARGVQGTVASIATPRVSGIHGEGSAGKIMSLYLDDAGNLRRQTLQTSLQWRAFLERMARLDECNRRLRSFEPTDEQTSHFAESQVSLTRLRTQAPPLAETLRLAVGCDAISSAAHIRRTAGFVWILRIALLAALAAQLYSGPVPHSWLLASAIALVLLATGIFGRLRILRLDEDYLDYRALAESLRVEFYMALSGIQPANRRQRFRDVDGSNAWIRDALRAATPMIAGATRTPLPDGAAITARAWVDGQSKYFTSKRHKNEIWARLYARRARGFFIAALAATGITLLLQLSVDVGRLGLPEWALPSMTVVYGMCFAIAAEIKLYAQVNAFDENAKRYRHMLHIFLHHRARLGNNAMHDRAIIAALAEEALIENEAWYELQRARPLEVPIGG